MNGDYRFVNDEERPVAMSYIEVSSVSRPVVKQILEECYDSLQSIAVVSTGLYQELWVLIEVWVNLRIVVANAWWFALYYMCR